MGFERRIVPDFEVIVCAPEESFRWNVHDYPHHLAKWHYHPEYELHLIQHSAGEMMIGDYVGGFEAGRGANLGWNEMEGTHPFEGGSNPEGAVLPIHEYPSDAGCSVIGGYVYRGDAIPSLQGTYIFGDYCTPGVSGVQLTGDQVLDARTWPVAGEGVRAFGQDNDGELFVLLSGGAILKLGVPG